MTLYIPDSERVDKNFLVDFHFVQYGRGETGGLSALVKIEHKDRFSSGTSRVDVANFLPFCSL